MLALLVSIRHRLVTVDPTLPDDRSQARVGVIAGADYYPWLGAGMADLKAKYNPGAGSGRLIQSTLDWNHSTVLLQLPTLRSGDFKKIPPPAFVF